LFLSSKLFHFILLVDMSDIPISSPDIPEVLSLDNSDEYSKYIFIFIFIFISIVLAILLYFFYKNREKKVTFQDKLDKCYGDVCYRE
jgi:phosphotransferase system  glucose/maltose/N-acetylglucosamine-specific IIC component